KVLGRDVGAARIAQVIFEACGADFSNGARSAVAEEPLSRQLLAAQQDPREPAVVEPELDELAGLGLELEPDPVALDRRVPALQRREAHRAVLLEVAAIADSDAGEVEELRGSGEHGRLVRLCDRDVVLVTAPYPAEAS